MSATDNSVPEPLCKLLLFGPSGETRGVADVAGFLSNDHETAIGILAYGLAHQRRYTGLSPVTVARHSVLVSHLVPASLALQALLHDAQEAIVGDVAKPVKQLLQGAFDLLEAQLRAQFARYPWASYGGKTLFPVELESEIQVADWAAARLEEAFLLSDGFFFGQGKTRDSASFSVSAYRVAEDLLAENKLGDIHDDIILFWRRYWQLRGVRECPVLNKPKVLR